MSSLSRTNKSVRNFTNKFMIGIDCWEWNAAKTNDGYGAFYFKGSSLAHRYSYELFNGKINEGLVIDHVCKNRSCVNPNHLKAVKQNENCLQNSLSIAARNRSKTHCIRGHEFNEKNTYQPNKNKRDCRLCRKERKYEQ